MVTDLVHYTMRNIEAHWSDGYAPSFPSCGYTEFWIIAYTDEGRELFIISCPFRLDIFDAKTEELIKMRFDDDIQRENYEIHRQCWQDTCMPFAEAIVAAFVALKG